jgi:hypothetical protein
MDKRDGKEIRTPARNPFEVTLDATKYEYDLFMGIN